MKYFQTAILSDPQNLFERDRVFGSTYLETKFNGFPRISQLVNGKAQTVAQLLWFQITVGSRGKSSDLALLGNLSVKSHELQEAT